MSILLILPPYPVLYAVLCTLRLVILLRLKMPSETQIVINLDIIDPSIYHQPMYIVGTGYLGFRCIKKVWSRIAPPNRIHHHSIPITGRV
ncbi:hypothetical protein F4775DRAFT_578559 [Biscogniauxia sp. FL1348]|nr:hypothetical protein F4775DRAFT_578559 [Biscogniauxia sp. FL1348]